MAGKLKSISKQIHWSLALKAAVFAAAWLALPWWLFLFVALYCYYIPFFHQGKLFVLFACLMALTAIQAPGLFYAFIFGIAFYYICLIKDLLIIDRRFAYEILVCGLSFFLIRDFFMESRGLSFAALFWSFFLAVAMGLLADSIMRFFEADVSGGRRERPMAAWLVTLLSWQLILAGLVLSLNFVYQSIIVFLAITFFFELIVGHFSRDLLRERIFVTASVFFALLVFLLASANWKL